MAERGEWKKGVVGKCKTGRNQDEGAAALKEMRHGGEAGRM